MIHRQGDTSKNSRCNIFLLDQEKEEEVEDLKIIIFKFVILFLSNVTDDGSQSLAVVSRSKLLWNWIFDLKDKTREEVKIIAQFE